ncbi:TetR/AcrR family transcriptional regulator [Microbacterium gorillae]|uniref:TetR/AcrR family transcriptional regulator n=1 Tax=Microbacterium gorillae TaxID=1231063 RepID=UPI0006945978|nr:TetR/AcrR family transcriptional regulator [Microbacterium gorillae]
MTIPPEEGTRAYAERVLVESGLLEQGGPLHKRPNRRGEATRDRIIQAAVECFTEYGYTKTRVSDITHRAGTAQGNFYRHFTSLDDVFLAALAPALEDLASPSSRQDRRHGELESLIDASTAYLTAYSRHRHMLRLLREAAAVGSNDGFRTLWLRVRQDYVDRTLRWLERLEQRGVLSPGEDKPMLAEVLGCMTEQVAYVHVGMVPTAPRREELERLGVALGTAWFRTVPRRRTADQEEEIGS